MQRSAYKRDKNICAMSKTLSENKNSRNNATRFKWHYVRRNSSLAVNDENELLFTTCIAGLKAGENNHRVFKTKRGIYKTNFAKAVPGTKRILSLLRPVKQPDIAF